MKNFPWWIFKYVKELKLLVVVSLITLVLNAGLTSFLAYFVKTIVNNVFVTKNEHMIKAIPLILIGLVLAKGIIFFINYYSMAYIGQRVIISLREELYEKVLTLPLEIFSKEPPSNFISKIINDTNLLQDFSSRQIATFLRNLLTALGLIAVIFYQDWKLATIGLIGLPLIGYIISLLGKKIRKYTNQMQEKLAKLTGHLFEGVKNLREIKLLGAEERFIKIFTKENWNYFRKFMKIKKVEGIYPPIVELTGAVIVGFLIYYGGMKIVRGELSPGAFFSFIIALIMAYEPIRKLGQNYNKIQQSIAVAERIKTILDLPDEYKLKDGEKIVNNISEICFNNVNFRYPETESYVLKNISLTFKKGKKYAIVGKTGSGKSTLINLIPRFYDPTSGTITINGINAKELKLKPYRKLIGLVSQDIVIFNGTILENISISKPNASLEEIIEAAKIANIHDFIETLPDKYYTVLGEEGISLSGGQKQRIAIARAILKNPDVLILDEATSALDSETEKAIQKAIDAKFKEKIIIAVAHRLSTVLDSDTIIFMKNGEVVGYGTHEELYKSLADYKNLCDIQFKVYEN
jgi:subfamily B ATP-binding cassette protein MsbA